MRIRIGTRGSALALWQANETARLLTAAGHEPELVTITTTGDRRTDVSLAEIGGKGLFIKELEEALDRNEIDVAVHSLKDVPSLIDDRFELAAFLPRADAHDVLLHRNARRIADLEQNARVGTSSPRRRAQLLRLRRDLIVIPIRGNVPTRAAKVDSGECDAVVLAAAGLARLGKSEEAARIVSFDEMIPAAGQGIVAIEIARHRGELRDALRPLNDTRAESEAMAERGLLQKFGTRLDCYSCIAVHSIVTDCTIRLRAFVSDLEATRSIVFDQSDTMASREKLLERAFDELCRGGALELLQSPEGS
jgi:hydroxymethylbilane synthase